MPFKDVDTKLAFPALEQSVAQWWKQRGIIKQSLESGDRARPFIFFEGPPTANGRPGVHHVEARVTKDLIVRYQRMRGHYVIGARGGWDTHGLPVEVEVEKELASRISKSMASKSLTPSAKKASIAMSMSSSA
jgi:isoleucyl-tRNA synthetase